MEPRSRTPLHVRLLPWLFPLVLGLFWAVGSRWHWWNPFLLPGPDKVAAALVHLVAGGSVWTHIGVSAARVYGGFVVACLLALPLALLQARSLVVRALVRGPLGFLQGVPPLALVPLIILWLGIGEGAKVTVVVLSSFFPVYLTAVSALASVPKEFDELGRSLRFSRRTYLRIIVAPSVFPQIYTGMKLGVAYSWRALVGAEMIAASAGLGYLILDAEQLSRTDLVVAGILVLGGLCLLSDLVTDRLGRLWFPWSAAPEGRRVRS